MTLYRVTFNMDGMGVIYDRAAPIHLDGLVAWAGSFRYQKTMEPPGRDDPVQELPIPVAQVDINGSKVYLASALHPVGVVEHSSQHYRQRFRFEHDEHARVKSVNYTTGPYRLYNNRLDLVLCQSMEAWFVGDRRDVKKWFAKANLSALGHKRAMGYGRVLSIDIDKADEDRCITWEGRTTRFFPHPDGLRLIRPRPPYWNITNAVPSLGVGEEVPR